MIKDLPTFPCPLDPPKPHIKIQINWRCFFFKIIITKFLLTALKKTKNKTNVTRNKHSHKHLHVITIYVFIPTIFFE